MQCDDAESDKNVDYDIESLQDCENDDLTQELQDCNSGVHVPNNCVQDCEYDDLAQELQDCNSGVHVPNNCYFSEKDMCADGDDLFCEITKCNFEDISQDCSEYHDVINVNYDCNKECRFNKNDSAVPDADITNEFIEYNQNQHSSTFEKYFSSDETNCSSDVDEAEILRQCDILMTYDYLPEGLVQDTCGRRVDCGHPRRLLIPNCRLRTCIDIIP